MPKGASVAVSSAKRDGRPHNADADPHWRRGLAFLAPALLMKRTIPSAALSVMPNCGHTINLEAPDLFNGIVGDFVAQVRCRSLAYA